MSELQQAQGNYIAQATNGSTANVIHIENYHESKDIPQYSNYTLIGLISSKKVLEYQYEDTICQVPQFFRKTGPLSIDFDSGYVYRRDEDLINIKQLLIDKRYLIIQGIAASGKSVLVRETAYDYIKAKKSTYMLRLKEDFFNLETIIRELDQLGKIQPESLVIFEDVHLFIDEVNQILAHYKKNWPLLLITMRPLDQRKLVTSQNFIAKIPVYKLKPFDHAKKIIELFCNHMEISYSNKLAIEIETVTQQSFWILAYALQALRDKKRIPGRKEIKEAVRDDLTGIQHYNKHNPLFPRLLISLSVLYQYEIYTDQRFIEETFGSVAIQAIEELAEQGEVICIRNENTYLYGLPHSSLAKAYLEFTVESEWEHNIYKDPISYTKNYILSEKSYNGLSIFSKLKQHWSFDEFKTFHTDALAKRISGATSFFTAGTIFEIFNKMDPNMALQLVNELDINQIVQYIEKTKYFWGLGYFVIDIKEINNEAASKLMNTFDLNTLIHIIEKSDNIFFEFYFEDVENFLDALFEINSIKASKLVQSLDYRNLARNIENADYNSAIEKLIKIILKIDFKTGVNIIKELDITIIAHKIEKSNKLFCVDNFLETIYKADENQAVRLIEQIDFKTITKKIEEQDYFTSVPIVSLINILQKVSPDKVISFLMTLDLNILAKKLENNLSFLNGLLNSLKFADYEIYISFINTIDLSLIAKNIGNGENLTEILNHLYTSDPKIKKNLLEQLYFYIETIGKGIERGAINIMYTWYYIEIFLKIDITYAKKLLATIELNNFANIIEHEICQKDVWHIISSVSKIDKEKGESLFALLNIEKIARNIEKNINTCCIREIIIGIQSFDKSKIEDLFNTLNLNKITLGIEKDTNFMKSIEFILTIKDVDQKFLNKAISLLKIDKLAERIEKSASLKDTCRFIETILEVDNEKGNALVNTLNIEKIVDQFEHNNLNSIENFLKNIKQISTIKAKDIVKAIDFQQIANRLEKEDLWNGSQFIKAFKSLNGTAGAQLMELLDVEKIADRFRHESDLCFHFIESVYEANTDIGNILLNTLDFEHIAHKVEYYYELSTTNTFIKLLKKINNSIALKFIDLLDINKIVQKIVMGNFFNIKDFIYIIKDINPSYGYNLIEAIDTNKIAQRICKDVYFFAIWDLIDMFKEVDTDKAINFVTSLDSKKLALVLENNFSSIEIFIKDIFELDKDSAVRVLKSLNLFVISDKIINNNNSLYALSQFIDIIYKVSPDIGTKFLDYIDKRKIKDKLEQLSSSSTFVDVLYNNNRSFLNSLLEQIDYDKLARNIEQGISGDFLKTLYIVSEHYGKVIYKSIDLSIITKKIESGSEFYNSQTFIRDLYEVDNIGKKLIEELDFNKIAKKIEHYTSLRESGNFIRGIYEADFSIGNHLLEILDLKRMAKKIEQEVDLKDVYFFISCINEVDIAKGRELIVNLNPDIIAIHVENSPIYEIKRFFDEVSLDEVKRILCAVDLNKIANNLEKEVDFPDRVEKFIKYICTIEKDIGGKLIQSVKQLSPISSIMTLLKNMEEKCLKNTSSKNIKYQVILHNDDITTMEFVVYVIEKFFGISLQEAIKIMLNIHNNGTVNFGIFSYEEAIKRVDQVTALAIEQGFPLKCTIEKYPE